jgi:GNAT superfamily N-acetyltransferase
MSPSAPYTIRSGYQPGAIGRIAELHGAYYHRHWDFGLFFEAKVATELAAFLERCDDRRDGFWTVWADGRAEGSIVIDGAHAAAEGAHLRWFIVSETLQGRGAGRRLLETALDFCRRRQYGRVFLWTFEGLHRARRLYESVGFELVRQQEGVQWGATVVEQYFVLETGQVRLTIGRAAGCGGSQG